MQPNVDREQLESQLLEKLNEIKTDAATIEKVKTRMIKMNILSGTTQKLINSNNLSDENLNILAVLTKAVHDATRDEKIMPERFFTEREIKESISVTDANLHEDLPSLPLSIPNSMRMNSDDFMTVMSIRRLKELWDAGLLNYNFETQRDPKRIKRHDTIMLKPNVNKKSVREITEHLLHGTLVPTVITLNARAATSNSGDEIEYDLRSETLTITDGTIIDVLDGFHRLTGAIQALEINPELEFNFYISIKNYKTKTAQQYVAQINTVNKMAKSRVKELSEDRKADLIVKELMRNSELKGKVSQSDRVSAGSLVTFSTLSDSIDQVFGEELKTKRDEIEITDYLTEFFNYLFAFYEESFTTNLEEIRKESLINNNIMFSGYITLAKKFKEKDINLKNINKILDKIDFNRNNKLWSDLKILDNNGYIATNAMKNTIKYFKELEVQVSYE